MPNFITRILDAVGLHAHAQNLTDDIKPMWRYGRAWIRRAGEHGWNGPTFRVEWSHLRSTSARIMLDVDPDERSVTFSWAVPGLSHFYTLDGLPRRLFDLLPMHACRKDRKYATQRSIGLRFFDGAIWWAFWEDEMEWRASDPWWMQGSWHPLNSLFGRHEHSVHVIEERDASIPMPERGYQARIKMAIETWERPRWPWWPMRSELRRAHVEIPGGIGFPGKGENAHDIGDDATYGMTTVASSVEEAIGKVVASVLHDRQRHGGSHTFTPSSSS